MTSLTSSVLMKLLFVSFTRGDFFSTVQMEKVLLKDDDDVSRGSFSLRLRYAGFKQDQFSYLNITSLGADLIEDNMECGLACLGTSSCFSYNLGAFPDINGKLLCELLPSDKYNNSEKLVPSKHHHHFSIASQCSSWPCKNNGKCVSLYEENSYVCVCKEGFYGKNCETADSCKAISSKPSGGTSGTYDIKGNSHKFQVYCHMTDDGKGWTLIARFSNNDVKNWMRDDGYWWYDQQLAMGTKTDPSINSDMISPAFWLVSGRELKITRSNDSSHTPLLQTTGNCLGGQTFRSKITGYGDFRNGTIWSSDRCLGSCTVRYGGQFKTTDGFQQAECSGGIQSSNKIGFWCDWSTGDGSVMMIGGGGRECARADHGIGITEDNEASFVEYTGGSQTEYDFGYDARTFRPQAQSYSLNLWIG